MKKLYTWLSSDNHIWTPKGLITRALIGVAGYLIFSLLGFREYTSILSGTSPTGHSIKSIDIMLMGVYVFSYLYATVVSPILCLAGGLIYCADKFGKTEGGERANTSNP